MTTTPLPTNPGPAPRSNKLLIGLIAVAGVLLLAVVAIVFLLIGRGGAQPSADGDPTVAPIVSPTASPTPTAAPVTDDGGGSGGGGSGGGGGSTDTSVRFTAFDYDPTVYCDPSGNEEKPSPSISWASECGGRLLDAE